MNERTLRPAPEVLFSKSDMGKPVSFLARVPTFGELLSQYGSNWVAAIENGDYARASVISKRIVELINAAFAPVVAGVAGGAQ